MEAAAWTGGEGAPLIALPDYRMVWMCPSWWLGRALSCTGISWIRSSFRFSGFKLLPDWKPLSYWKELGCCAADHTSRAKRLFAAQGRCLDRIFEARVGLGSRYGDVVSREETEEDG